MLAKEGTKLIGQNDDMRELEALPVIALYYVVVTAAPMARLRAFEDFH